MELKDYWAALVAGWKVIVATVLVALLVGGAVAFAAPAPAEPEFLSVRKVLLTGPDSDSPNPDSSLTARTLSYAELAAGTAMAGRVRVAAGLEEGSDVGVVSAVAVPSTTVIQLSVSHSDEDRAKSLVDTYVRELPEAIAEVDDPQDGEAVRVTLISSLDDQLPAAPSGTSRIILLALILGLGLGIGWALLRYAASAQGAAARR